MVVEPWSSISMSSVVCQTGDVMFGVGEILGVPLVSMVRDQIVWLSLMGGFCKFKSVTCGVCVCVRVCVCACVCVSVLGKFDQRVSHFWRAVLADQQNVSRSCWPLERKQFALRFYQESASSLGSITYTTTTWPTLVFGNQPL